MARQLVDRKLERAFVASVPFYGALDTTVSKLLDLVAAEDFDDPESRRYWHAIEELVAERGWFNPSDVLERADRSQSQWTSYKEGSEQLASRGELSRHATMVADLAANRRLRLIGQSVLALVEAGQPVEDVVHTTQDHLLEVRSAIPEVPLPRTLRNVKETPPEKRYNWAVQNWLEFKDRVMITGREGGGKMSFLRQLCVQFGIGFHPWEGPDKFEPLRTLQVDLQDGQVRNEREFDIITDRAGVDPFDHLFIESRDAGINVVRSVADRRWLEGLIRATRPHVVALGPIYQMCLGEDSTDAVAMQLLIDFINRMRTKYDIIWLIEAHSPKAAMSRVRSWEPFGSQRFLAWPDAGYGIVPDSKNRQRARFHDWRGNRDMLAKVWPTDIVWGDCWPWVTKEVKHPSLRHLPKQVNVPGPDEPPDDSEPF